MEWGILDTLSTEKIGPALWITTKNHMFSTPRGLITVPAGFIFDHASVPRIFTGIVPPVKSPLAEGSLLHDWWYCRDSEDVPREFADEGLRGVTISRGGSKTMANLSYYAVRMAASELYNIQYSIDKLPKAYPEFQGLDQRSLDILFVIRNT